MEEQDKTPGTRRSRGRPPSPPGVSRNHRVVTFVNEAEYLQLTAAAARQGETLSMVAYKALQSGLPDEE